MKTLGLGIVFLIFGLAASAHAERYASPIPTARYFGSTGGMTVREAMRAYEAKVRALDHHIRLILLHIPNDNEQSEELLYLNETMQALEEQHERLMKKLRAKSRRTLVRSKYRRR